jgi:hypothetical protein
LFCCSGFNLNAQSLNYSLKKDYLKIHLENLQSPDDSAGNTVIDYVNGKLYKPTGNSYANPYYDDNSWKNGTVWYLGRKYDIPMLKYDLNKDILIHLLNSNTLSNTISFKHEFVKEFTISGHHFIYLDDFDQLSQNRLKHGYYELLFDGMEQFYVRREKLRNSRNDPFNESYTQWNYFFLKKEGKYLRIKGNPGIVAALKDHKKEVRSFIRHNNIRISKENYDQVRALLAYYDNLKRND